MWFLEQKCVCVLCELEKKKLFSQIWLARLTLKDLERPKSLSIILDMLTFYCSILKIKITKFLYDMQW